jgi:hypothetical protein
MYPKSSFAFRCPICSNGAFREVVVARGDGKPPYRTEFYECSKCSAMFRDAGKFSYYRDLQGKTVLK